MAWTRVGGGEVIRNGQIFGYVLRQSQQFFVGNSDVGYERHRMIKDDSKIFD